MSSSNESEGMSSFIPNPAIPIVGTVFFCCQHEGENVCLPYVVGDTRESLLSAICSHWGGLDRDLVTLHYSMTGYENCALSNQRDFMTMVSMAFSFSIFRVPIRISVPDIPPYKSAKRTKVVADSFRPEPYKIPEPYPLKAKPLLTDGWDLLVSEVGQQYEGGASEFRLALRKTAIGGGFNFEWEKNDSRYIKAYCALASDTGCEWYVCAAGEPVNGFFYVKEINNQHKCGACFRKREHVRINADLVCSLIVDDVRAGLENSPNGIINTFSSKYGLDITYDIAYNALEKSRQVIIGDKVESFDDLRWYVETASLTNKGSKFELELDEKESRFKRLFISFKACIDGFSFCRPMLFIDGTHLKGKYKGHLLAATGKDGNEGLYPLAIAVVDAENLVNWNWFLENLRSIIPSDRTITFISDRNPGLLSAMQSVFPGGPHSYCLRHMIENLKDKFSKQHASTTVRDNVVQHFVYAAYSNTIRQYEYNMGQFFKEGGDVARIFIHDKDPRNWATAHFVGTRYGELYSNSAESFNSWIKLERDMPIVKMIDCIRMKLMRQLSKRRKMCATWTTELCPKAVKKIAELIDKARPWVVNEVYGSVYEVQTDPTTQVNLDQRTCTCMVWQNDGFPCVHAVAAILKDCRPIESFVQDYFKTSFYAASYAPAIYPVPTLDKEFFRSDDPPINAPNTRKPPGRPRKARIPSVAEGLRKPITCSRCGTLGRHNKKTCKEPI